MIYNNIVMGRFISRPNRFIAQCEIDGVVHACHVKNTGRCRELLTENVRVFLDKSPVVTRKTAYDLVGVYKGDRLINMDSQAPNKAVAEYLPTLFPQATLIKAEKQFGGSRFDFYVECDRRKIFVEVKGVTLEQGGYVLFPDAPTQRGLKHMSELVTAIDQGYEAYLLFVVQMAQAHHFSPNNVTHPAFGQGLASAIQAGVKVMAFTCSVTPTTMEIATEIPIIL